MFGHRAGHVRVMVLDADPQRRGLPTRERRREVVGVQVVNDDLGLDPDEALEALERALE